MEAQYLKNNHVTYYVITQGGVYAAQQWYAITSDVTWPPDAQIKSYELVYKQVRPYVHSSKLFNLSIPKGYLEGVRGSHIQQCGKDAKPLERSGPNLAHVYIFTRQLR